MPDVEPLRFPSREGRPSQPGESPDQADLQAPCSGRRRACALLNSPLPCVNNATYHIQELKMAAENWCQQSGKYPPQINQDKHQYSNTLRFQSRDSDTESVTSAELFVEGVAISARESCPLSSPLKKINDVLGEVTCLIERLEADRQYAEVALRKEKRRKRFLENQVDGISQWKQQERSLLIQKEHDACIKEISELKWQLKLDREKLDQAREKLSYAEAWNRSLREDIDFAKKQMPVVKANLELQRGIINQINAAQAETDEVYSNTRSEFLLLDEEKKKMELDANDEMISMDRALSVTKNQLASTLDELNQLKMLEEAMWAEIKDAEKTIALTGDKCSATTRRVPELLELEKTASDWILQSELEIEDEMRRNAILNERLVALQGEIEKTVSIVTKVFKSC